MAKIKTCVFCNKQMEGGFFTNDAQSLTLGNVEVTCCPDCHQRYHKDAKNARKRMSVKMENYRKSTRQKPDEQMAADFFLAYVRQEQERLERFGPVGKYETAGYFAYEPIQKLFAVHEFPLGGESTLSQTKKDFKKLDDVGKVWYSKEDVTKLEFRKAFGSNHTGFFSTACAFEVRFNDEKVLSEKPCIARMPFVGAGLFPHTQKKKAKLQCIAMLKILREAIGSDLEVREVKKFN